MKATGCVSDLLVRSERCALYFFLERHTGHASPVACPSTDELSLAVSVCFTIQTWCIAYLDLACLWLFTNADQINRVFIVHMVPIEELPTTRAIVVMGLSSPLDSDVNCLDNNKLDFQIKSQAR